MESSNAMIKKHIKTMPLATETGRLKALAQELLRGGVLQT
jgi:hypothetical protein